MAIPASGLMTREWPDPVPARIGFEEWAELFETIPDELIQRFHYFPPNQEQWSLYLFPPQTFAIYGCRHLRRLKFDNSLAALRMWGFVQNETERLFRARQTGRHVVACMGDLGALPVIVNSFPGCVAFYPDCIWWTPFVMESQVLFDAAAEQGIPEATCFSRAALGAFAKHSYFPDPDLVIAATGASCDDYSGVEQLAARHAREMLWVESPLRRSCGGVEPPTVEFLVSEYRRVVERLERLTGHRLSEEELRRGVARANRVRQAVAQLRQLAYGAGVLPALEMMVIEFGNLHFYSDIGEWTAVVEHLLVTARARADAGQRVVAEDALRIVWVTPPADPLLLCYLEDRGGRVVGTEFVINQALAPIDETKPGLEAIACSFMAASLIGTSRQRAELVLRQASERNAEGVLISGILGGSHCAMEARLIADRVKAELDLPVLEFDVAKPGAEIDRQTRTRIDAFLELLRSRR
uniref:2-hydroxyacyl-CoA dehydratase n=1 Tax=candidate division WOR-3 bacterium TaxID=2052148 RepID=A0A7C4GGI3_UNCW3